MMACPINHDYYSTGHFFHFKRVNDFVKKIRTKIILNDHQFSLPVFVNLGLFIISECPCWSSDIHTCLMCLPSNTATAYRTEVNQHGSVTGPAGVHAHTYVYVAPAEAAALTAMHWSYTVLAFDHISDCKIFLFSVTLNMRPRS